MSPKRPDVRTSNIENGPLLSCHLKACNVFFPYRLHYEAYCDFAYVDVDDWLIGMWFQSIFLG